MTRFEQWWVEEGSRPKFKSSDWEEHCKMMCFIAWNNGAYVEREECADLCEKLVLEDDSFYGEFSDGNNCAKAIRARGQE